MDTTRIDYGLAGGTAGVGEVLGSPRRLTRAGTCQPLACAGSSMGARVANFDKNHAGVVPPVRLELTLDGF